MVTPQAEAQKLAAIDASTGLGSLADSVVLATIRAERELDLTEEDRAALVASASWLEELASLMRDPLDLERSLQDLGKLDLIGHFVQLGTEGLSVAVEAVEGLEDVREAGEGVESTSDALLRVRDLVRDFSAGRLDEDGIRLLRAVFEYVAQSMLASVDELMTPRPAGTWTTESGSSSASSST